MFSQHSSIRGPKEGCVLMNPRRWRRYRLLSSGSHVGLTATSSRPLRACLTWHTRGLQVTWSQCPLESLAPPGLFTKMCRIVQEKEAQSRDVRAETRDGRWVSLGRERVLHATPPSISIIIAFRVNRPLGDPGHRHLGEMTVNQKEYLIFENDKHWLSHQWVFRT